ncbi:SNF2 domain-containing protein [Schleiferilactobacillus perolens DSM 12744]|uniref:SNF2 domain-containing protein n=2 Tax=Schleiferilactobacillus perolens TaxID=100468 RepID=A0A0R1MZU0_9LACO|nr:SNF2 domain-containing protein [Schleiferilactobacillus perolens DSM 12744]
MGLGKTLSTLTAIADLQLLEDLGKVLIVAPLAVARNTWPDEIHKWDSTKGLSYSTILGSAQQRSAALQQTTDLYITNRENVPWLVEYYGRKWPFKTVVIDELSSFKSPQAKRFKALRKVRPLMHRVIGLTGTPAPNSLMDLWPQMYLLDRGTRLGLTIGDYRRTYFHPGMQSGYVVYNWVLNPGADKTIYDRIGDITISMQSKELLDLPPRTDNIVQVEMTPKETEQYKQLQKDYVLPELGDDGVTASNAAVLANKLLQLANGAIYDDDGKTIKVHDHKLDALANIIDEAQGQSVLVFYQFKHDAERILKKFPQAKRLDTGSDDVHRWNAGKIPMLLAQPQSAGHGLNLQAGGHIIVWFGLTWSLEYYQQANARLMRQGQTQPVIVHHIITKDTIDERVMTVLQGKARGQAALLNAVKAQLGE